jgi:hypothetical protein
LAFNFETERSGNIMNFNKLLKRTSKTIAKLPGALKAIKRMVSDPELSRSYYPDDPRKSKTAIWLDLLWWWLRHQEINDFYFYYGLDRKKGVHHTDFMSYSEFRKMRDRCNRKASASHHYNYVCILRDKFVFGQFVSSLGFRTPKNLALFMNGAVCWLDGKREIALADLCGSSDYDGDYFCKSLAGLGGEGAFPLRISAGRFFVGGQEIDLEQLRAKLNGDYLLQEALSQHPEMNKLYPHAINTIRILTFRNGEQITVLSAIMRIGTGGNRVDNHSCGGLIARIDLTSGRMSGDGIFAPGKGTRTLCHPDTSVVIDGFQIPFFPEAVRCVTGLHRYLYGVHSVGWDVGITPEGPIIIEGNDNWGGCFSFAFEPGFKVRFLQACAIVPEQR